MKFRRHNVAVLKRTVSPWGRRGLLSLLRIAVLAAISTTTFNEQPPIHPVGESGAGGPIPGYCAQFLYLVQCAAERRTAALSAGPDSAVLQLVYRAAPEVTCGGGDGRGGRARPFEEVLPRAFGWDEAAAGEDFGRPAHEQAAVRVWGDCEGVTGA
jgi:hypothetical protein